MRDLKNTVSGIGVNKDSLVYEVGGMEIDEENFIFPNKHSIIHKFVMSFERGGNEIYFYVAPVKKCRDVVEKFELDRSKIVAGGDYYISIVHDNKLFAGDYSVDFLSAHTEPLRKSVERTLPVLGGKGIYPKGIKINSNLRFLNQFWIDAGFKRE